MASDLFSDMHGRYEAAMADDPFGASDSLRYWLHSQFVVLGTLVAVSARAGVLGWLKKIVLFCFPWPRFSLDPLEIPLDQQSEKKGNPDLIDYFTENAWSNSCRRLGYRPGEWKPQAAALARLLVFHLLQPATYVAIYYLYAPLLWRVSEYLGVISFLVLLREALYAGFSLYIYANHGAFMLFSLNQTQDRFHQLVYVISPDKMMILGMAEVCNRVRRNQCYFLTFLFLFVLDVASGLGLAICLVAQIFVPPMVAVWSLTAAAPVLFFAAEILSCLRS